MQGKYLIQSITSNFKTSKLQEYINVFIRLYGPSQYKFSIVRQNVKLKQATFHHKNYLLKTSFKILKYQIQKGDNERRSIYRSIWFWKYWREGLSLKK